jgi:hypothetical protein
LCLWNFRWMFFIFFIFHVFNPFYLKDFSVLMFLLSLICFGFGFSFLVCFWVNLVGLTQSGQNWVSP